MKKTLVTVVLTIERNLHHGQRCIAELQQNGFVDPILKIFPAAPKGSSMWAVHLSIMDNHYNVVKWFVDTYDTNTHDLMVCEDDCEFIQEQDSFTGKTRSLIRKRSIATIVHEKINVLHENYDWSIFMVGHIAYGPMMQTQYNRLSHTLFPITSHCFVYHGAKLPVYLNKVSRRWWITPFMIEGWLCVPLLEKFALFPSAATQNRQIKGLDKIPFLKNVPVIKFIRAFEYGMHILPFAALIGLSVACCNWLCH